MVNGFLQLCEYFLRKYPGYYISPLRLNISALESFFSCVKYQARGNLSGSNYTICHGRVMWRKDLQRTTVRKDAGYRDQELNIMASTEDLPDEAARVIEAESRTPTYIRIMVNNAPFRLNDVSEFLFPANLAQSTIGDRQCSNACALISVIAAYSFMKFDLESLRGCSELPKNWFLALTDAMANGNSVHDFVFAGAAADLDVEDIANTLGDDMNIESYETPIFVSIVSDHKELVTEIQNKVHNKERCCGVITVGGKTVSLLLWDTGHVAVFDSHQHPPSGAILGFSRSIESMVKWLFSCLQKYFSVRPQFCDLTWIKYDVS